MQKARQKRQMLQVTVSCGELTRVARRDVNYASVTREMHAASQGRDDPSVTRRAQGDPRAANGR